MSGGPTGTVLDRVVVPDQPGGGLLVIDLVATLVLALTLAGAVVVPDALGVLAAAWSVLLFLVGCVLFLWALATAAQRSRGELIGLGGLFFLTGVAPDAVRRRFMALLVGQTVVSLAAAAARPFTVLAFGVLAPMFGLGIQGLWAARHGRFDPRAGHRSAGSAS